MTATTESFHSELQRTFAEALAEGRSFVEVSAGELHRAVGDYANGKHRMPTCCRVMRQHLSPRDQILYEPPKGAGSRLSIRYALPRTLDSSTHLLVPSQITEPDEVITIPRISLAWSPWHPWGELLVATSEIELPRGKGVYEVRRLGGDRRLHIGKAADLRSRVQQGLVRGNGSHSTGDRIRAIEDLSQLEVRWAETDWPASAEEALHKAHRERYGALPFHTKQT